MVSYVSASQKKTISQLSMPCCLVSNDRDRCVVHVLVVDHSLDDCRSLNFGFGSIAGSLDNKNNKTSDPDHAIQKVRTMRGNAWLCLIVRVVTRNFT